ncbi:putative plastid-lipid-associated protein 12 chloroplastic [Zea mays]|uniref:Putative plastid-lipid-associated protein 12 chloroplastic n=1 Tax=Zea mays TaxID=4577 RepID=A0A1D6IAE4_MAIZE|nr:putative plastid-lipid-associated protein 12 chloroplastic [Zea mays]
MAAAPAAAGGLMQLQPPLCVSPRASASCAPSIWGALPQLRRRRALARAASSVAAGEAEAYTEPELVLLEALLGIQGRGRAVAPRQLQEVESAVQALETQGGIPDPTSSSLIEGSWRLIFTTRPGTASPIQRTFVGVDSFRIFQEVYLRTDDPRVVNVVKFSESVGDLKVEVISVLISPEFQLTWGFMDLHLSYSAEATIKDGKRILFRFDRAAFAFKFLPFKVPYPVPFRLLGDEANGWLDTTYLSHTGNIRISRGNKVINDFISSQNGTKADLSILVGEWQLLWCSQTEALHCTCSKNGSGNTFTMSMKEGAVKVGGLQFPLDAQGEFVMEILYGIHVFLKLKYEAYT